jgi:hypothetical protein
MINLRYHIVSLTAVFLAIGIGLTLGSTFLDRATVENLNGQLQNLEARLGDRDTQIEELESALSDATALQTALDEQGTSLLADRLEPVPVVVVASQGVDEADVTGVVASLQVAGADVQGLWWLTDRFLLNDEADIADLAAVLEEPSADPARLRRLAIDALGGELRVSQRQDAEVDVDDEGDGQGAGPSPGSPTTEAPAAPTDPAAGAPDAAADPTLEEQAGQDDVAESEAALVQALTDAGFISFEPVPGGPEVPILPAGARLVIVGGSADVPDDVVVEPLVERLARGADEPIRTVVTSAMGADAAVSEVVAVIRDDQSLRAVVSTVDGLDHFQGWVATVLAVEDVGEGIVGHYGLGEGASSLLPPLQAP